MLARPNILPTELFLQPDFIVPSGIFCLLACLIYLLAYLHFRIENSEPGPCGARSLLPSNTPALWLVCTLTSECVVSPGKSWRAEPLVEDLVTWTSYASLVCTVGSSMESLFALREERWKLIFLLLLLVLFIFFLFGNSISITFISCHVKTPDRSIKGGRVSSGSQFKGSRPWGQESVKSLRRCAKLHLQPGSRESVCWCSARLFFSVQPRTPAMESSTFKLDLLPSISPI